MINLINVSSLVKNPDLNAKLATLATKAELKAIDDKIVKLHNSSNFCGKNAFSDDGFQKMFFYQPTFNTLELRKDKSTDYVIGWKSKDLCKSKLLSLHGTFLPNI